MTYFIINTQFVSGALCIEPHTHAYRHTVHITDTHLDSIVYNCVRVDMYRMLFLYEVNNIYI